MDSWQKKVVRKLKEFVDGYDAQSPIGEGNNELRISFSIREAYCLVKLLQEAFSDLDGEIDNEG
jgi:hypothetical protein